MIKTKKGYLNIESVRKDIVHISFSKNETAKNTSLIIVGEVSAMTDDNCIISVKVDCNNSAIEFTNSETGEVFLKEKKKYTRR